MSIAVQVRLIIKIVVKKMIYFDLYGISLNSILWTELVALCIYSIKTILDRR
jgi:hypothetical protein